MKGLTWHKVLLWGDRLARWGIALVFLIAAVPKLSDVHGFARIIDAYGILANFLILPTAIILPLVEVLLAIGLFCNSRRSMIGSLVLLLLFIALLSYSIWVGLDIDCGCFGPEDPEYTAFHGLRSALLRDIVMCLLLIYSFWFHKNHHSHFQIQGEIQR